MSRPYQVLARKWRPQRFDDVIGQVGVTQTLRNALARQRIAQAYIFSGARGVGKTTTARILAKALNCLAADAPTAEPCGTCDACVEIAGGRDLDVIEIDAASNTGVENVREVIINGLAIAPARDRFKVFIIDEVHMLSNSSFNALLKSIEEPPPHVVFMMATTELQKIPDTIRSRSQEFEFRTIGTKVVADQLAAIAEREGLSVDRDALTLIARAADGSMRDALSAFDQVIAFSGGHLSAADVSTVLGLIARDALLDIVEVVAEGRAADVFTIVGRLVEGGQDLKLVCRELTALVRDLMVVRIDASRLEDVDLAPDAERLSALAGRFSREDLLRGFDVLAKAEQDIRFASQPRFHLEMALLKWIHLGQLQPLAEVIAALGGSAAPPRPGGPGSQGGGMGSSGSSAGRGGLAAGRVSIPRPAGGGSRPTSSSNGVPTPSPAPGRTSAVPPAPERAGDHAPSPPAASPTIVVEAAPSPSAVPALPAMPSAAPPAVEPPPSTTADAEADDTAPVDPQAIVEALRKTNRTFFGTALARAQFAAEAGRLVITLGGNFEQQRVEARRAWIEDVVFQTCGRKLRVTTRVVAATPVARPSDHPDPDALKQQAMQSEAVQALLDVFPADIRDVEQLG